MTSLAAQWKVFWQRARVWLRVVVPADGLEITDHALRWCRFVDGAPQILTVKVPPGVMQDGKIVDRPAMQALLKQLHDSIAGPKPTPKKNLVVLTLGSAPTFVRLFYLPFIERNRLEQAIDLNLQMISPADGGTTNAGWQLLSEDVGNNRFELAGVFVARQIMADFAEILQEAGFIIIAAESKALSLARTLIKEGGLDPQGAYIAVACDDAGMEFMIMRKSILCFSYTIPWHEIADEQGQVSDEHFAAALTRGVRQISNFYEQHWSEPVAAAVIVTNELMPTVQDIVSKIITYPILAFAAGENDKTRGVPVAYGAALRGVSLPHDDQEVNLLGPAETDIYEEERMVRFLKFWRVVLPVILGAVVIGAVIGNILWFGKAEQATNNTGPTASPEMMQQLGALAASSSQFNQEVALLTGVQKTFQPKYQVLARFASVAASSSVAITHLVFAAQGGGVTLAGTAPTEDLIVAFKNALIAKGFAKTVTLPFSSIQPSAGGYLFTMTLN